MEIVQGDLLKKHTELLITLSTNHEGISDDEDDPNRNFGQARAEYKIRAPWWRSTELTIWLRSLDLLYLIRRFNTAGKASRGNMPRTRVESSPTTYDRTKGAIKGLPRNCYNPRFLSQLKRGHIEALGIEDVDYDFTMPSSLQLYDSISFKCYADVDSLFI